MQKYTPIIIPFINISGQLLSVGRLASTWWSTQNTLTTHTSSHTSISMCDFITRWPPYLEQIHIFHACVTPIPTFIALTRGTMVKMTVDYWPQQQRMLICLTNGQEVRLVAETFSCAENTNLDVTYPSLYFPHRRIMFQQPISRPGRWLNTSISAAGRGTRGAPVLCNRKSIYAKVCLDIQMTLPFPKLCRCPL
jgi:hypothetical protein